MTTAVQFRVRRKTPTSWWRDIDMRRVLNRDWTGWSGAISVLLPLPQSSGSLRLWDLLTASHGDITGPSWVQNEKGTSLLFDGTNDYVSFRTLASLVANQITVLTSVRRGATRNFAQILSSAQDSAGVNGQAGFELRLNSNTNRPEFLIDGNGNRPSAIVSTALPEAEDRFLAGRYDGSRIWCYAQDQAAFTNENGNIQFGSGANWHIGTRGNSTSFPFAGQINFVLIFNIAKSDNAIFAIEEETKRGWPNAFNRRRTSYVSLPASTSEPAASRLLMLRRRAVAC